MKNLFRCLWTKNNKKELVARDSVSANEIIKELVNSIQAAIIKKTNKIKITKDQLVNFLPDGSTEPNTFNLSVLQPAISLRADDSIMSILFRVTYTCLSIASAYSTKVDSGEMINLIGLERQLEGVYNISLQYFPEEIYLYIFYSEFEYYSCKAKFYGLSPITSREDRDLYNKISCWATRNFYANFLNSFYDIVWEIAFTAGKGLYSVTVPAVSEISHSDDSTTNNNISVEELVLGRLRQMGFTVIINISLGNSKSYTVSWTAKEFKISEAIKESEQLKEFLNDLQIDHGLRRDSISFGASGGTVISKLAAFRDAHHSAHGPQVIAAMRQDPK